MLSSEHINLYIAELPEWQRLLMVQLRQLIHAADEQIVEKWQGQCPHFEVDGLPLLSMNATKTCVNIHFPKGAQFKSTRMPYEPADESKPSRTVKLRENDRMNKGGFTSLVQRAAALNRKQAAAQAAKCDYSELESVLRKDPSAWANWESFNAHERADYLEWVSDGPDEETCKRRIAQSLQMVRKGQVWERKLAE